jgi:hypothetical protein
MEAIVGRDVELGTIETWLTSATSPVLLLEGDAGIGKTTLWRATVQRGRELGMRILASIATEPESRLPGSVVNMN